jgi:hypothetical protein
VIPPRPLHFYEGVNKRFKWIAEFVEEKYYSPDTDRGVDHKPTSFDIYWAMTHAIEGLMEKYPLNRRKRHWYYTDRVGGKRWTDDKETLRLAWL